MANESSTKDPINMMSIQENSIHKTYDVSPEKQNNKNYFEMVCYRNKRTTVIDH
jgi:hypothetical protein